MRHVLKTENGWYVRELAGGEVLPDGFGPEADGQWLYSEDPTSVQDVLIRNGVLPARARFGDVDIGWVSKRNWLYRADFPACDSLLGSAAELVLNGVDCLAEIYFNGSLVAAHNDAFLRCRIDVTGLLQAQNTVCVRFFSPDAYIDAHQGEMPEAWRGWIDPARLLRKATQDSGTFLGNQYPCPCIGLYDDVFLELYPRDADIGEPDIEQWVSPDLGSARVRASAAVLLPDGAAVVARLFDPAGQTVWSGEAGVEQGRAVVDFSLQTPCLWWPRGYGKQPLYHLELQMNRAGAVVASVSKRIGFRLIEHGVNFDFRVNGTRIRLYGANWVNVDGVTHWCDPDRVSTLFQRAVEANFNVLRLWGEAPLMPDLLYELADEHGVLIWQDFGLGFGLWPDDEAYRALFRAEASQMVARLKHHPALLLWCGSNETYMTCFSEYAGSCGPRGAKLILEDASAVCAGLDPTRPYIPSSPMGGDYPQDARAGDIHGYWGISLEPGVRYPNLFSESCHATTYAKHSMLCFMAEEEIWPAGYHDTHTYQTDFAGAAERAADPRQCFSNSWRQISVPATWDGRISRFATAELWNLERYYDAVDADSLLYKYAVCGADFFKEEIERIRRGRPCDEAFRARGCQGYLIWKYNDAFPHINFTMIDYFLEPTAQYYAIKRAFAPILGGVACEQERLYVWAVNDTAEEWRGRIRLRLFSRMRNRVEWDAEYPLSLRPDEARIVDNLDHLGPVRRECVLHTELLGEDGGLVGTNIHTLDMERNLCFPQAALTLRWQDDCLLVTADQYARYVELRGSCDGDAFGFGFSDNYFDLVPFETKRITLAGRHKRGIIAAKAHYSQQWVEIAFEKDR